MSVKFIYWYWIYPANYWRAQLSGAQLSAPKKWQIGPRTVGPRGPVVRGPTVRPEKVTNWAPDSWAPEIYYSKIIKKTNTASKIQTEMLPNVNFVPFRPNVVLKRQDTSFQLAKNHCKSHNRHPKYQYHHPNHQIPTT